jgi:hypothetical protein
VLMGHRHKSSAMALLHAAKPPTKAYQCITGPYMHTRSPLPKNPPPASQLLPYMKPYTMLPCASATSGCVHGVPKLAAGPPGCSVPNVVQYMPKALHQTSEIAPPHISVPAPPSPPGLPGLVLC